MADNTWYGQLLNTSYGSKVGRASVCRFESSRVKPIYRQKHVLL